MYVFLCYFFLLLQGWILRSDPCSLGETLGPELRFLELASRHSDRIPGFSPLAGSRNSLAFATVAIIVCPQEHTACIGVKLKALFLAFEFFFVCCVLQSFCDFGSELVFWFDARHALDQSHFPVPFRRCCALLAHELDDHFDFLQDF